MPVRKALLVEGENKVVNYLLHREYELTKSSWSKLQKKYNVSKSKVYAVHPILKPKHIYINLYITCIF